VSKASYPFEVEGGLVYAQKWTVKITGNTVTLSSCSHNRVGGGKRKECKGMSDRSRRAMLSLLNRLEFRKAFFVTLTYHRLESDAKVARNNLYAFRKALERFMGRVCVIWRLELQKRGACHFHLLVLDPKEIDSDVFAAWAAKTWNRVSGEDVCDDDHLRYGVRVDKVGDFTASGRGALIAYLAKYVCKENGKETSGRAWGCWRKKEALCRQLEFDIPGVLVREAEKRLRDAGGIAYDNPSGMGVVLYLGDIGQSTEEAKSAVMSLHYVPGKLL
jgi:hypothetical protein